MEWEPDDLVERGPVCDEQGSGALPEHLLGTLELRGVDQHGPDRVARRHQPFEPQPPLDDEDALVERAGCLDGAPERRVVEAPEIGDPRVGGVGDHDGGHRVRLGPTRWRPVV